MTARALMLQGTGSDVGKSLLTAALCRLAARQGIRVAPFKAQNMSNNAAVCPDGGEIGRAQALQAQAAGVDPHVDMNPVLLKPESDQRAQIVLQGRALASEDAAAYMNGRQRLLEPVLASFHRLAATYDLIIVEGAGSPAEINLRRGDIANMGFARAAGVPVCLVGDIDRGGVIASLVGTQAVLEKSDAAMIQGFLVNKFRGDPELFVDGIAAIESITGWPSCGLIPWVSAARLLPAEDAVVLDEQEQAPHGALKVAAPLLSRIANFDDAAPLIQEPSVAFQWIKPGEAIPRDSDVVILFGSKSTLSELRFIREQGWDHDLLAHARTGGRILGLCGGYQLLGRRVHDPEGLDGPAGSAEALGLLDVETRMERTKTLSLVNGYCATSSAPFEAYEIHSGVTEGEDTRRPFAQLPNRCDGARSPNGRIEGSYLHGVFRSDAFRRAWLSRAGGTSTLGDYDAQVDRALDALTNAVARHGNTDRLFSLARPPGWSPDAE